MKVKTKAEMLEYLGKDKKDVKLIDRMIARGEIVKDSEGYEYNNPVVAREKELKEKIESLEWLVDLQNTSINNLKKEIEELKKNPVLDNPVEVHNDPVLVNSNPEGDTSDLDFQIQENERLEGEKQELIEGIKKAFIYFGRGTQWSEFIEKIGVSSLLWDMELE